MELQRGTKVNLTTGGQATVVKELGRGGQGIVYLVEIGGMQMALKWYLKQPTDKFYNNLSRNVVNGAPSSAFLWPEYLTMKEKGSFGYLMKLRPQGYYEFGNFIMAKKNFISERARITAAIKICDGFMQLHRKGLSYQDLNDGNFFINPQNGDVLICDNDNVFPFGENSGILGKARYMAPEIVLGKNMPNTHSDRFSLSVILFFLLYVNHPFEGAKAVSHVCLTEEIERKLYGSEILFLFDADNNGNAPVRNLHKNVINRWPMLPGILRQTFIEEFCQEKLKNPQQRMIETEWKRILAIVNSKLVNCPHCGKSSYVDVSKTSSICQCCGKTIQTSNFLEIGKRIIPLSLNNWLYIMNDIKPDARVLLNPKNQGLYVQNASNVTWTVDTPSGKTVYVEHAEVMPVKPGLRIRFNQNVDGIIK